jgi:hypothetical protein
MSKFLICDCSVVAGIISRYMIQSKQPSRRSLIDYSGVMFYKKLQQNNRK